MGMTSDQLDQLDAIAEGLQGTSSPFPPLSTGEKLYVALAASRADLLAQHGYTIPEAMGRLLGDDLMELIRRWRSR